MTEQCDWNVILDDRPSWMKREMPNVRFHEALWEPFGELPKPVERQVPVWVWLFRVGSRTITEYPRGTYRRMIGMTFRLPDGREWAETDWQYRYGDREPETFPVEVLMQKALAMQRGDYQPWVTKDYPLSHPGRIVD